MSKLSPPRMVYVVETTEGPGSPAVEIAASREKQPALDLCRELNATAGIVGRYQVVRDHLVQGEMLSARIARLAAAKVSP